MNRVAVGILIAFLIFPVVYVLWPKPVTLERVVEALENAGLSVANLRKVDPPMNDAVAQVRMTVSGAPVCISRYDAEGTIAIQYEYHKPDVGEKIVESWHLREALGAAPSPNLESSVARKGMLLLTVSSNDDGLRARIVSIFESL